MRFPGTLLGFLALPAAVIEAAADACPQPGSEIATDRPDTTNSSLVVPQGSLQQENGVNISGRDGGQVLDGTNTRLRFGIAPCLEALVDVPTYFDALSGRSEYGVHQRHSCDQMADQSVAGQIRSLRYVRRWAADRHQGDRGSGRAALRAIPVVVGIGRWLERQRHAD